MSLNHFISAAGAIVLATALSANSAYAQTSFNATFNSAPSSPCSTGQGCTNFTLNLGGTDFLFEFTSAGDGGTMIWENGFGDGNSPSMNCQSDALSLISTEVVKIKRVDSEPFQFTSIFIDNAGGTNVTIAAYRGGNTVGTSQFATNGSAGTYAFSDILVDEVRLSATDMINTNIDSFRGIVPAVNAVPVISTSGGTTGATEQIAAAIDNALSVTDADSSTLASATVSITAGFVSGQDVLSFTNNGSTMGNIAGAYNAGTGVLTLTSAGGSATLAQWQTALRSVTYTNTSDVPNTANRTISFVANDGTGSSVAATKTVSVSAVNDAPAVAAPANINAPRNQTTAITGISGSDADAGGASVTMTFSIASGTFSATSGGGVTVSGSGTSAVNLAGTVANINAFIAASNVSYTSIAQPPSTLTLTVTLNDNGNTGSGGAQSDSETVTITITAPSSVDSWMTY